MKITLTTGIIALCLTISVAASYLFAYYRSLRPPLLFTVTTNEWIRIVGPFPEQMPLRGFRRNGNIKIKDLCIVNGFPDEKNVVCFVGEKDLRLVPHEFHEVFGTIKTQRGDDSLVYAFRYDPRYEPLIGEP